MLSHYLYVAFGGALGAVARVAFTAVLPPHFFNIPIPIMIVNITGCFLIGILSELMALFWSPSEQLRYFLIPGILGGFTTFSSFALEFGYLMEKDNYLAAVGYAILSVTFSLLFFFVGMRFIRYLN